MARSDGSNRLALPEPPDNGYVPYEDCLLWQLSDFYFQQRGLQTWRFSECPFVLTSNQHYAWQVAWVLHAAWQDLPAQSLNVLETGAGHGVFSYYFLQALQTICEMSGCQHAQKLTYWVSDYSPRYLQEISCNPLLQAPLSSGRLRLGQLNVLQPNRFQSLNGEQINLATLGLDAILCNYVLDALPLAVYRLKQGQPIQKKWVQTQILSPGETRRLPHLFQIADTLLVSAYHDCDLDEIESEWLRTCFVQWQQVGLSGLIPVSIAGFQAVQGLYDLLHPKGLLWLADKGFVGEPWLAQALDVWPQLYGVFSAHDVNFPLLSQFIRLQLGAACLADPQPQRQLKTLLVQKSTELDLPLATHYHHHFISTNRNELHFKSQVAACEQVLQGQGQPL